MKFPALLFISVLALPCLALASPRLESNSLQARHDLLLLGDSAVVASPIITWPWPLGRSVFGDSQIADFKFEYAQERLREIARDAQEVGVQPAKISLALATEGLPFRSFGYQPREEFQTSVSTSWLSEWTAGRLSLSFVDDPSDGDEIRLDGSYFGVALGNWMLALDQVERWWGPGWDGSLILSNNARPIPAVSLTRLSPDAFENRFLRWIGLWTFTTFMGQLDNDEGERPGSDALLFGMRIDFSPFGWENLDIGLSRTAQWAGEGRPDGLDTLWKLFIGEDNRVPGSNVTDENEPGNQLAGVDYRLKIPKMKIAQYGQVIGEDEETYLPDANMLLFGAETWGELDKLNATWRAYFEWADTRAGHLLADPESGHRRNHAYNIAYNHGIYREGYRYKGRSIGHAMDGDGLMRSIGAFIVQENGNLWGIKLRDYAINRDGRGPNSVSIDPLDGRSVELFSDFSISDQPSAISHFRFRIGAHWINEENVRTGESEEDIGGYLSISKEL